MNPNFVPPVIDEKYVLTTHLKSGGYGSVYSGYNADTHTPVVGKLEAQDGHSVLSHEYQMMLKIQDKGATVSLCLFTMMVEVISC